MKELKELVAVVTRNKTKAISIIGNGQNSTAKLQVFYDLIASGEVSSDEEAFQKLYPGKKSKNSFYKLKHKLKKRLYNTAILVDAKKSKFSSRKEAFLECQFLLAVANKLNALNARINMLEVCEKVLKIGAQYDFTAERIMAAKQMINVLIVLGDEKRVTELMDLVDDLSELQEKENLAHTCWGRIQILYVKDRSLKTEVHDLIKSFLQKLNARKTKLSSSELTFHVSWLEMAAHLTNNDYPKALKAAERGLQRVLIEKEKHNKSSLYSFRISIVACCIPLKKFARGQEVLQALEADITEGHFNWFKTKEMFFILLLHTRQYAEAAALHQKMTAHKSYKKQPGYLREIWMIYGAYLRILANAGRIPLTGKQKSSPFRIRRYLNDLPTYSKDKRGQNVPILVSHILLQLQQGKLDAVDDRLEALDKYRGRYTGVEKNFRGNVFLHMLKVLPKADFDREVVERKTHKLRHLLSSVPIDVTSQGYDQEVLPYEDTWDLILEALR